MEAFVILSDIHANLTALNAVLDHARANYKDYTIIILGDMVNYGMRPNEVIEKVSNLEEPVKFILSGNHENALRDGNKSRFSTDRGRAVLDVTRGMLTQESLSFLEKRVLHSSEHRFFTAQGKRVLAVHGSLADTLWGSVSSQNARDPEYAGFDFVLSGHSHIPLYLQEFHPADIPAFRNKHRTIFINPGSVGQPRNQNPRAQYAYWEPETETLHFNCVPYDVAAEQALYDGRVDIFYRDRLTNGI